MYDYNICDYDENSLEFYLQKNELLNFINSQCDCDLITHDNSAIVYEFYAVRKVYEFTYYIDDDKIYMRTAKYDEFVEFGFDSKEITQLSQLKRIFK